MARPTQPFRVINTIPQSVSSAQFHFVSFTTAAAVGPLPISSAGVFDSTGALVRTLWSAETNYAGVADPAAEWDGTLDDETVAPTGTYTVTLIQHNIQYTWDGAVGNSSPDHDTLTYHNYGSSVYDMCCTGAGEIYFTTVYDERWATVRAMLTTDIQNSDPCPQPQGFRNALVSALNICTDGTITYIGNQAGASESQVYGIVCATKLYANFPSGTIVGGNTVLGRRTDGSFAAQIYGLAVQQSDVHIFLARPFVDEINIYNKTSGASVTTFSGLNEPKRLVINPTSDSQLWIAYSSTTGVSDRVVKCSVNGSGVISTTATVISVENALGLAISPDGSTLLIADGGNSHLVRAYNTSDGSVRSGWGTSGTLGTSGGYVNSPAVTNTKFMFFNVADFGWGGPEAFVAYQPDGKFWIGDAGNQRCLRFTSGESPAFDDYFIYISGFYPCRVCKGDPTRVFANFLEYEIDYSITLAPGNGSWQLVNNWAGNLSESALTVAAPYNRMKYVGTYSNGRTYATADLPGIAARRFFELTSTGLRSTDWNVFPSGYIDGNMDLWFSTNVTTGSSCTVTKNAFTGFDVNNNPSWAVNDAAPGNTTALNGGDVIYTTQTLPARFPFTHDLDNNGITQLDLTANGTLPFYDVFTVEASGAAFNHFGGVNATTGLVKFNTHPMNSAEAGGYGNRLLLYPPAPAIPEGITNGGGPMVYIPGHAHVFTVFNGEEWGNNQTNVWTHWHESGLALSQFGPAAPYFGAWSLEFPDFLTDNIPNADPWSFKGLTGMAGNCRWGEIAYVNSNYYIYQNDEWYHGGITRWKVSNLDQISTSNQTVNWNSGSYVPVTDPTDLLAGLDFEGPLVDGTGGWFRTHAEVLNNLHIFSGGINADRRKRDLAVEVRFYDDGVYRGAYKALTAGTGDWTVYGTIFLEPGLDFDANPFVGGNIYFDILDSANKIILRWYVYTTQTVAGTIIVNGDELFPPPANTLMATRIYVTVLREFSIAANVNAGTISFTYDVYNMSTTVFEVGADINDPATLRIAYFADGVISGEPSTCVTDLHFVRA